jgi:hypothetical protein
MNDNLAWHHQAWHHHAWHHNDTVCLYSGTEDRIVDSGARSPDLLGLPS